MSNLDEALSKLKVLFKDLIYGDVLGVHDLVDSVPLKICLWTEKLALTDVITIIFNFSLLLFFAQIFALFYCLWLHT